MKHYIKNFVLVIAFLSVTIGLFSNVMNTVYAQDINVNGFSHPTCVDFSANTSEFVSNPSDIPFYAEYEYNANFVSQDTIDVYLQGSGLTSGQNNTVNVLIAYTYDLDDTNNVCKQNLSSTGNISYHLNGKWFKTPKLCHGYYTITDGSNNIYYWNMDGYYLMDEAINS